MRWWNIKSMNRVGAAALVVLISAALPACGDSETADVPRAETEEEAGLKREILEVERRLDGLQNKVKEVMEGLKGEAPEEKPADATTEKAETPSEELQRVMESLETPIVAEAPEEHAAQPGEEANGDEGNREDAVAEGAPETKPAEPGEEVKSGGKPEAPVAKAPVIPALPKEKQAEATRKVKPPAAARTPKARPSPPVEEIKEDAQEKPAAVVAKAPAPAAGERNTATLKAIAEPVPLGDGQEERGRPRPSIGPLSPAPAPEPAPAPAAKTVDDLNHFDLGLIEWRQNNLPAAIVHFKAVIASEPGNAHAYWNLALVYDQQGEGTNAIRMMEEAEKIYKNYGDPEDMRKARDHLVSWHEKYGTAQGTANREKS